MPNEVQLPPSFKLRLAEIEKIVTKFRLIGLTNDCVATIIANLMKRSIPGADESTDSECN